MCAPTSCFQVSEMWGVVGLGWSLGERGEAIIRGAMYCFGSSERQGMGIHV